jgi:ABC-type proline/glycine betaine transport system ATPase subunit
MGLVTNSRFIKYQNIFFNHVQLSDMIIELGIEELVNAPSNDFLTNFTGSNQRSITWYSLPALYETNIENFSREKYGLTEIQSGAIYISPLQLIPLFGTHIIDRNKTLVRKSGHEFILDRVQYLEPLYGSCIAIELMLKDKLRG